MGKRTVAVIVVVLLAIAVAIVALAWDRDDSSPATTAAAAGDTSTTTLETTSTSAGPASSTTTSSSDTIPAETTTPAETTVPISDLPPVTTTIASSTTTTTLPPADDPDAGAEEAAPVPLGQAIRHGDWEIGVSKADLDATEAITAMYDFNQPPPEGSVYVLVELSGTNIGSSIAEPVFNVALVNGDFRHSPTFNECGQVAYALIDVNPQTPGSHMTGNVCFLIPEDEVSEDLVLTLGFVDEQGREKFFALR